MTTKMDPILKEVWCWALESGDYKQGTNALRTNDNFCCLGVACDLYEKAVGGQWVADKTRPYEPYLFDTFTKHLACNTTPPHPVLEWLGVNEHNPYIDELGMTLAHLNDNGKTFKEIAAIIREYL